MLLGRILFNVHLLRVGLRRQQQKVFTLQSKVHQKGTFETCFTSILI